jgi:hypothetical protein
MDVLLVLVASRTVFDHGVGGLGEDEHPMARCTIA